jgi:hypothetical protein
MVANVTIDGENGADAYGRQVENNPCQPPAVLPILNGYRLNGMHMGPPQDCHASANSSRGGANGPREMRVPTHLPEDQLGNGYPFVRDFGFL